MTLCEPFRRPLPLSQIFLLAVLSFAIVVAGKNVSADTGDWMADLASGSGTLLAESGTILPGSDALGLAESSLPEASSSPGTESSVSEASSSSSTESSAESSASSLAEESSAESSASSLPAVSETGSSVVTETGASILSSSGQVLPSSVQVSSGTTVLGSGAVIESITGVGSSVLSTAPAEGSGTLLPIDGEPAAPSATPLSEAKDLLLDPRGGGTFDANALPSFTLTTEGVTGGDILDADGNLKADKALAKVFSVTADPEEVKQAVLASALDAEKEVIAAALSQDSIAVSIIAGDVPDNARLSQKAEDRVVEALGSETGQTNAADALKNDATISEALDAAVTEEVKDAAIAQAVQESLGMDAPPPAVPSAVTDAVAEALSLPGDEPQAAPQEDGTAKKEVAQAIASSIPPPERTDAPPVRLSSIPPLLPPSLITVTVKGRNGHTFSPTFHFEAGSVVLVLDPEREFTPGMYTLEVTIVNPLTGESVTKTQDFAWGVLAMNTDQDTYEVGQTASLAIGVLDDKGKIVCDAGLRLSVTAPSGAVTEYANEEARGLFGSSSSSITVTDTCGTKDSRNISPDYEASILFAEAGTYTLALTAKTKNGTREMTQRVTVRTKDEGLRTKGLEPGADALHPSSFSLSPTQYDQNGQTARPIIISRKAATRLYPFGKSPMDITVRFNEDFKGDVTETVPESFAVSDISGNGVTLSVVEARQHGAVPSLDYARDDTAKYIVWHGSWKAGQTAVFHYDYDAPDTSPDFFTVGPLSFDDGASGHVVRERRAWQIANDVPDGWLTGWAHRKKITIDNANVDADLADFPVLVKIQNDTDLSAALQTGLDIRFTDSGGRSILPYERESYSFGSGSGSGVFWVKSDIDHDADTTIYVYYGNASATDGADPTNVWDASYKAVYHLSETSGTLYDSTSNDNDLEATNAPTFGATGKIGKGITFASISSQYLSRNSSPVSAVPLTLEYWAYHNADTTGIAVCVSGTQSYYDSGITSSHLVLTETAGEGYANATSASTAINTWTHVVGVNSAIDNRYSYTNGVSGTPNTTSVALLGTLSQLIVGKQNTDNYYFDGTIDEVRVSNTARAAEWIKFEYHNQGDSGNNLTFATQENNLTWLSGWSNRKKITIDHTKVGSTTEDETNFPVLISLSGITGANTNGTDIRFTADDGGTYLAREIESYASNTLVAWVKIPTLSHDYDTSIYMYYGNSGATEPAASSTYGSQNVWDSNFKGVWHLKETGTVTTWADSTSNANSGTNSGATANASGKIGGAGVFNGSSSKVVSTANVGISGTGSRTMSLWIKTTAFNAQRTPIIFHGAADNNKLWLLGTSLLSEGPKIGVFGYANDLIGNSTISTGTWYNVEITFDGTTRKIFLNGASDGSDTPSNLNTTDSPLTVGWYNLSTEWDPGYFNGLIDEIRISNTTRTAGWISTEYQNQNSPSTFYTTSTTESSNLDWLTGWSGRKKITIKHTNVDETLSNFPLLVKFTSNTDLANALATGNDIRFTQSDGSTLLKYEKESWTGGNGTSATANFWVKIPTISNTTDTDIYVYYGNSGAADGQDITNVYNSLLSFSPSVWLRANGLSAGTLATWLDKSGNGNNAVSPSSACGYGSNTAPTVVSDGLNGMSVIRFGPGNGLCEAAMPPDPATIFIVNNLRSQTNMRSVFTNDYYLYTNGAGDQLRMYRNGDLPSGYTVDDLAFHSFSLVYNGASSKFFADGTQKATGNTGTVSGIGNIEIGTADRTSDSDIAEIFVVPSVLSDANRQFVEAYLKYKWIAPLTLEIEGASTGNGITWTNGTGDNLWSTAGNWQGGVVPGTADTANFTSSATGNCNIDTNISVAGINITNGYTGTITQNSTRTITVGSEGWTQAGGTFTGGDSAITMNGAVAISAGTFTSTTGTLTFASTFTNAGTFNVGTGTIAFTSASTPYTLPNLTYNNLTVNNAGTTFNLPANTTVNGALVITAGTLDATASNYTISAGTWSNAGTFTPRSGTLTLTNTGTFSDTTSFYNLTINGSGKTTTLGANLTVTNNLTITAGTLDVSASNYGVKVAGTFTNSGTFTARSGTVMLNNTTAKTFTPGGGSFNNLTLNDGLVGYWKLDEGSGTSATDSSGYGNTGTLTNGPTYSSTIPTTNFTNAKSLSFDGTDDYVSNGNSSSLQITTGTVSAWVKTSTTSGTMGILIRQYAYGIFCNNGTLWIWDWGNFAAHDTGVSIADGSWHHVTESFQFGVTNGTVLYVDGVAKLTTTINPNANFSVEAEIGRGGTSGGGETQLFNGLIDDVRIYNRALTAGEVTALAAGNEPATSVATTTLGGALTVSGDLTLNAGTLDTSSGNNYAVNVAGNWYNNGGVFTPNSGTVTLNGTNQSINSSNTFYNLTKSVSSADTLTFGKGSTQTITNTCTLNGAASNLLSLRSSLTGTQWKIDPQSTRTLSYLDVKDSNNTNATAIPTADLNITDSGNNTNWTFDITPPTVSTLSPADDAANASPTANLVITFAEAVDPEAGAANDITIKKASDHSTVETIDALDARVTGGGTATITINPAATLDEQTAYEVLIGADAFDDAAGNSYAGISSATDWNFTVGDFTAPAVLTLSPADDATDVSTAANLVLTFNETVRAGTGTLTIKKSSDDSTAEEVTVSGSLLSGNGTAQLTLNPSALLAESTGYYVVWGANAFKDSSVNANHAAAGTSKTAWSFTTAGTAPVISGVAASATSTTATITWTTDEDASSRVQYGATEALGIFTAETNTGPRVTEHTVTIGSLPSCVTFFYRPISRDAALNTATGSTAQFTTAGCTASATVSSQTGAIITTAGGSLDMINGGSGASLDVPADVSTNTLTFQIKEIDTATVILATSSPSGLSVIDNQTYELRAVSGSTLVTGFLQPITVTMAYTDSQASGYDESTFRIERWDGSNWNALSDCSVDTSANTVTCTTTAFSTFGLFGSRPASGSDTATVTQSSGGRRGGDAEMAVRIEAAQNAVIARFEGKQQQSAEVAVGGGEQQGQDVDRAAQKREAKIAERIAAHRARIAGIEKTKQDFEKKFALHREKRMATAVAEQEKKLAEATAALLAEQEALKTEQAANAERREERLAEREKLDVQEHPRDVLAAQEREARIAGRIAEHEAEIRELERAKKESEQKLALHRDERMAQTVARQEKELADARAALLAQQEALKTEQAANAERREERLAKLDEKPAAPSRRSVAPSLEELAVRRGKLFAVINETPVLYADVSVREWYAPYVSYMVEEQIATGYADATGRPTGEFGVAKPVTYAEVLKIALLAARKDIASLPPPRNASARGTWAAPFVAQAESMSLSVFASSLNVHTPATRGAVMQMVLEVMGFPIPKTPSTFADVPPTHPYSQAIGLAAYSGFVTGDTGPDGRLLNTFRPDDPINRAEVAKIIALIMEVANVK